MTANAITSISTGIPASIPAGAPNDRAPELDSPESRPESRETAPATESGFSFADLLDIINPLQHIPIVSTIYRQITGDEIGAGARILGGALFGGVLGLVSGLANALVERETGRDIGDNVLALLQDEPATDASTPAPTEEIQLASLSPRAGAASGRDAPPSAVFAAASQRYLQAAAPDPTEIYGRIFDIGP